VRRYLRCETGYPLFEVRKHETNKKRRNEESQGGILLPLGSSTSINPFFYYPSLVCFCLSRLITRDRLFSFTHFDARFGAKLHPNVHYGCLSHLQTHNTILVFRVLRFSGSENNVQVVVTSSSKRRRSVEHEQQESMTSVSSSSVADSISFLLTFAHVASQKAVIPICLCILPSRISHTHLAVF
jgi:hypothetical protein